MLVEKIKIITASLAIIRPHCMHVGEPRKKWLKEMLL